MLSNVIVDITIPRRSFVFDQSRAKVSAGFTNVRSMAVAAFYLVYCSLSVLLFVFVLDISEQTLLICYCHNINIHSKSLARKKWLILNRSWTGYHKTFFNDILKIRNADDILDKIDYPDNMRKVVVFDDLVNASNHVQDKIANHYTDGRHHMITPIFFSQSYYNVPQKVLFSYGVVSTSHH